MVLLFVFEFIEGNSVTRLYFLRLRRLTQQALKEGEYTAELDQARAENIPSFTHFLDLPMLFLIVALGVVKPDSWLLFTVGSIGAILAATFLTIYVPRLYPTGGEAR